MAFTGDQSFINQYSDQLFLTVREQGSKMMNILPSEMKQFKRGEKHFFTRYGKLQITEQVNRNVPITPQEGQYSRRMATVKRYTGRIFEDDIDVLKSNIDPTSENVREFSRAQGENFDRVVYAAMLGTAATGKDGDGTQDFDPNQIVGDDTQPLSPALFNEALFKLESNEVDIDNVPLFMPINAKGVQDMTDDSTNKFLSIDFQDTKMLAGRKLPMYRGVTLIRTQRVPNENATTTRSLIFTQNNTKVAMAEGLQVKVDIRNDLDHPVQITTYFMFGPVRMEESTIVDVRYRKVNP